MATTIPATVLLTRPKSASERFAALLDLPTVISPLMETTWLTPTRLDTRPDALVFTSACGVEGFVRLHDFRGPAFCVGDRTAEVARRAGFEARSAGGGVDELAALLDADAKGLKLVHARGRDVAGDLSRWATPYIVYVQEPLKLTARAMELFYKPETIIVPLFSPRSAAHAGKEFPPDATATVLGVAMSDNVAAAAKDSGITIAAIADHPDTAGMAKKIRAVASFG